MNTYKKSTLLAFKVTTSRGQNTYGYNIVSLYVDGSKVASTCGGGYDMRGTVLANFIKARYGDRLKNLKSNRGSLDDGTGFYGLTFCGQNKETKRSEYHKEYQKGDSVLGRRLR